MAHQGVEAALAALEALRADIREKADSAVAVFGNAPTSSAADVGGVVDVVPAASAAMQIAVAAASDAAAGLVAWAAAGAEDDGVAHERCRAKVAGSLAELHIKTWAAIHGGPAAGGLTGGVAAPNSAMRSWREIFAICCLMRCVLLATSPSGPETLKGWRDVEGERLDEEEALRLADLGLVVAGPEARASPALFVLAERVAERLAATQQVCPEAESNEMPLLDERSELPPAAKKARMSEIVFVPTNSNPSEARRLQPLAPACAPRPPIRHPILEVPQGHALGLEKFVVRHLRGSAPVVVRGGCAGWPAVARWDSEAFWCDGALGRRFVPVEVDYWMDDGFKVMTVRDFVGHCCASGITAPLGTSSTGASLSRGGYLAQHALFEQVPALSSDVCTPDIALCGAQGHVLRQVFFGPQGTVTPLHWDPYENAFCQVVGAKYLRLYPPSESSRLYARADGDALRNNSMVEPADILAGEAASAYGGEQGKFPLLVEASYVDVVLEAGDMLYLPRGWWHFVKSLSVSISVAFHFD